MTRIVRMGKTAVVAVGRLSAEADVSLFEGVSVHIRAPTSLGYILPERRRNVG